MTRDLAKCPQLAVPLSPRGDGLDLEAGALGDGGDLDAGAGGKWRAEGAGVGVVYGGEVREVGEEISTTMISG